MLYAPLRTLICIDSAGRIRLAVDQRGMLYVSFADPVITELGFERITSGRYARPRCRTRPGAPTCPRCAGTSPGWRPPTPTEIRSLRRGHGTRWVRDYRTHLVTVAKNAPRTINTALAAIDDFCTRRGLGPASADRLDLPTQAPRVLDAKTALRWIWAIAARTAPRDRVLALLPLYAGLRVSETVALDVDDVRLSARKGTLRVRGKDGKPRDLPIHAQLRTDLQAWLDERPGWPGVGTSPALLLNRRGRRLSVRGASDIIRGIAADANLDEEHITAHIGRHTFATTLVRGGTDLVTVADMLGHARLDTVRAPQPPHSRRPHQGPQPACPQIADRN